MYVENMMQRTIILRKALRLERISRFHLAENVKKFHICCCTTNLTRRSQKSQTLLAPKKDSISSCFSSKRLFSVSPASNGWFPWSNRDPPIAQVEATPPTTTVPPVAEPITASVDATSVVDPGLSELVAGAIVDPPFIELGLASSWWPNHFVHQLLEYVHLNTGLAWWSTIIIGTLAIRIFTMPMYIYTRKYTINQNNNSAEMKKLMADYEKQKLADDGIRMTMSRDKLKKFYKRTGTGPIRGLIANSSMTILFITCVTAMRQMCAVPVPSFVEGGVLWFTDLSSSDPYYVLPILTGATMGLIINVSLRGAMMPATWHGVLRKVQFLPVFVMPLVFSQTACGIYLYWLTTSAYSLCFQNLLLIPGVTAAMKFPIPKPPAELSAGVANKGIKEFLTHWKNDSFERAEAKAKLQRIRKERKQRIKERKKELKGDPPVTYTIGVEAKPVKKVKPDFERDWRPPKPKTFGLY